MGDALRALLQLGDELGHVVGERDRFGEALLLSSRSAQLGFEHGDVSLALGDLRGDLVPDLGEHELEDAIGEHVLLQMLDQRAFDLCHRLVDCHRADRVTAFVVPPAPVAEHTLVAATVGAHAGRGDRAAARAALRNAAQRVLRGRTSFSQVGAACREALLYCEPGRIVDDSPFR